MGGAAQRSSTQTTQIPPEVEPSFAGAGSQIEATQQALPLSQFAISTPRLTAGLSPLETFALNQAPGLSTVQPAHLGALASYAPLVGGQIGSSPATQAAEQAWQATVQPTVQNALSTAGLGRSGALGESLAMSKTAAVTPFIQQEIQNRMTAADQMRQLGDSMFKQQLQAIITQFEMGHLPRNIAQQLADSAYEDFLRQQALSESVTTGVFGQIAPSALGFKTTQQPSALDTTGQILGMLGMFAGGVGAAASGRRYKKNVKAVAPADVLDRLEALDIPEWVYKGSDVKHIGPIAEEFNGVFGKEGWRGRKDMIGIGDMLGVVASATKELNERVKRLEAVEV